MQALYHPAFGRTLNAQESYLPDDPDGQVAGTISLMRSYVLQDMHTPEVRQDAAEAIGSHLLTNDQGTLDYDASHIPQRELASRVFSYVKRRLSFVGDERLSSGIGLDGPGAVPIVEVLIRPKDMAVMCGDGHQCRRLGDCDDFSMYTAALLGALGIRSAFVTIAADKSDPTRFSHVYVAAYMNDGERVPMDVSHGSQAGWEYGSYTRKQEWPIQGGVGMAVGVALLLLLLARGGF